MRTDAPARAEKDEDMSERSSSGSNDYAFVPAKSVPDSKLIAFASAVWPGRAPRERIDASWWRRAEEGCAVAAVHEPTGAMAGLCGGRPSQWMTAGRSGPAVAICDWYVDPGHAGRGIGKRLVQQFEAPDRFIHAFSISDAAIVNFQKLGWQGPYASSFMMLPLPRLARLLHLGSARLNEWEFRERVLTGGALPANLGDELDRIEACTTAGALAHMRRDAAEWRWRLPIRAERTYRFCVAYRAGAPVGYVALRRLTPGRIRQLGRIEGAFITDLAAEDAPTVRALALRAVAIAADMRAGVVLAATTIPAHQRALARLGFLSPAVPLIGKILARRAPQFMWLPRGPAAALVASDIAFTFADATIDFDL
jgi:GNAT superfamily N-acetyltransferase